MSLERTTQVLVVGAGPVGMTMALLLARQGVDVAVLDEESGPAARSYACALHPGSLELLDRLGLTDGLLPLGRRVDAVVFGDGREARADVRLSVLPSGFPYLLVLPQSALEELLERALARANVRIHWNHRLSDLQHDSRGVVASVDKLGGSAVGYIVPHWETVVKKTTECRATWLVGADGHRSVVRQRLGLDMELFGNPERYAVFEFDSDAELPAEERIVFEAATTNVLWPLPGGRYRWSFQLVRPELHETFPEKERRAYWIDDPERNRRVEDRMRYLIKARAPWFDAPVRNFDWIAEVQFQRGLVKHFGGGPCRLVGDAAHQTGPAGVQSLNVGLQEADTLAGLLAARLRGGGPEAERDLEEWDGHWRREWRRLLGLDGGLEVTESTPEWLRQRAHQILPCLPGFGKDLERLAGQLRLGFS